MRALKVVLIASLFATLMALGGAPDAGADDHVGSSRPTPVCLESAIASNQAIIDPIIGVGSEFYRDATADFYIIGGVGCLINCHDGFDFNCDGKLGDYCPANIDRHSVKGAAACLEALGLEIVYVPAPAPW